VRLRRHFRQNAPGRTGDHAYTFRDFRACPPPSRGNVLSHDGQLGRVSEISPRPGILERSVFARGQSKGRFEAIPIAGVDIYLLAREWMGSCSIPRRR